jgi:ribosomal protein S18 acetylase RimI-like enzyme
MSVEMLKDYMMEEYGRDSIVSDKGFLTFSRHDGGECVIHDLYVRPDSRMSGEGISLCNKLFKQVKEEGFTKVGCYIDNSVKSAEKTTALISTYIKHGFKVINAVNNQIVLMKEI